MTDANKNYYTFFTFMQILWHTKSGYMICIYQFAVEKSQILNSIEYEWVQYT